VTQATQSVFDWLDLLFREGRPPRRNVIVFPLRPEHPLRKPQMPALSGLWASRACYPVEPQRHWRAVRPTGEMPRTNLCNRLSCHEYPRRHPIPKLRALARPTAAILLVHPSGWEPSLLPEAILGDAELPLLALQPWVGRAVGAAPASCYQTFTPEGSGGVPRRSPSGLCRPASNPMVRLADAPCRYPQPSPASRAHPREPGPASPHPNQRVRLFEPEAPSTGKSHRPRPSSRPNDDRMGRHWYPGFAASGPASDMRSRPNPRGARSCCLPTIRRGTGATCRLPASAMDCHPSTPTCRPISGVARGKPRPAR